MRDDSREIRPYRATINPLRCVQDFRPSARIIGPGPSRPRTALPSNGSASRKMAGRPHSAARAAAAAERIAQANTLPTEPRPFDQPAEYHPDLIGELMALADHGLSDAEIAAHWSVSLETLGEWREAHQAFRAAFPRARTRAKAWWERSARVALASGDSRYPAGLFSHVMRARHADYDDKATVTVNIDLASRLVVLDLSRPTGLPGSQTAGEAKPLIEGECVRLDESLTAEGSPKTEPVPTQGRQG